MVNWGPVHCLAYVPGKRIDAFTVLSVHWSIEMRQILVTGPLCLSVITFAQGELNNIR